MNRNSNRNRRKGNNNTKINSKCKPQAPKDKAGDKAVKNNPEWYAVDQTLLKDAASLPYSTPTGVPMNLRGDVPISRTPSVGVTPLTVVDAEAYVPGVMAYELTPTIGYSSKPTDPVNMSATQAYAYIRHANSGSANYDAPDIMLYFLAMADVYSYVEYLKRMYGVAQVYAQRNKYLPYTLLQAMKVDPSSLIDNLANFRMSVNMLINKVASFAVPNTMSLFQRRQFLYAGLYTEGTSIRDQLYMYVPNGFHMYNWQESKTDYVQLKNSVIGQYITTASMDDSKPINAMDLVRFGHYLIDVIINNEDLGIMNGDILKAYGNNILSVSYLEEGYAIAPAFDPYVLEQMQNASVFTQTFLPATFSITSQYVEDPSMQRGIGILVSKPEVERMAADWNDPNGTVPLNKQIECIDEIESHVHMISHVLCTTLPEPEPKDTMEITRLTAYIDGDNHLISGTEICTGCTVYATPAFGALDDRSPATEGIVVRPPHEIKVKQVAFTVRSLTDLKSVYNVASKRKWTDDVAKFFLTEARRSDEDWAIQSFKYRPTIYYFSFESIIGSVSVGSTPPSSVENGSFAIGPDYFGANISNFTVLDSTVLGKLHATAIMNEFAAPHVSIKV